MKYLIVCSEIQNQIVLLGIKDYKIYGKFNLNGYGPIRALKWKNSIVSISKQKGEISFLNRQIEKIKSYYIGPYLTDFLIIESSSIILSGDSNKIVVFDNNQKEIQYMIETAGLPLNIDYFNEDILVTNYQNKEVEIFSLKQREKKLSIKNEKHPFKSMYAEEGKYIITIEGFEEFVEGIICIYDSKSGKKLESYKTCNAPVDFCYMNGLCYVCDYFSDTIWEINLSNSNKRKISIPECTPNSIINFENKLLVCSEKNNKVIELDGDEIKTISIPSPRRIDIF